jgi:acetoin utilization protein AcuB
MVAATGSVPVRDWMSRPVATIRMTDRAHTAATLMKTRKLRHLPVVNGDGRLAGIVTDRDLRQVLFRGPLQARLGELRTSLATLPVRDVMTWSVITVRPDTDMREAARLMHERKIGALPVVESGKVVGMLTESDALAALERLLGIAVPAGVRRERSLHAPPVLGPRASPSRVRALAGAKAPGEAYDYGVPLPASSDDRDTGDGD